MSFSRGFFPHILYEPISYSITHYIVQSKDEAKYTNYDCMEEKARTCLSKMQHAIMAVAHERADTIKGDNYLPNRCRARSWESNYGTLNASAWSSFNDYPPIVLENVRRYVHCMTTGIWCTHILYSGLIHELDTVTKPDFFRVSSQKIFGLILRMID